MALSLRRGKLRRARRFEEQEEIRVRHSLTLPGGEQGDWGRRRRANPTKSDQIRPLEKMVN